MDPALAQRIRDADVLLAIGGRLGEIPTAGYTLAAPRRADAARWSTCTPTPTSSAPSTSPSSAIVGRPRGVRRRRPRARAGAAPRRRAGLLEAARAEYERNLRRGARAARARCRCRAVMATLRERLPDDAILTNGAGNFTVWAHRFYEFRRYPTQLAPAQRLDGLRRPGRGRRQGACTPSGPSSASPATATS